MSHQEKEVPVTDRHDQDLAARKRSRDIEDQVLDVLPAIERFLLAVDTAVNERLTDDDIEDRLQRVLRRYAKPPATPTPEWSLRNPDWQAAAEQLAKYGYRTVRIWLRALLTVGPQELDLQRDDVDELAKEAVARAINGFRDEVLLPSRVRAQSVADLDLKEAFLAQCVRFLPDAYRSHLLGAGRHLIDDLEEGLLGQPADATGHLVIVRALWHCVTDGRDDTIHRVGHGVADIEEIITLTGSAIRVAAQEYPDTIGQATGS
jgi:hypothetical protein